MKIFDKQYNLIIDSGSQVSVIHQDLINIMKENSIHENKLKILPTNNISLIGATGTRSKNINKQVLIDLMFNNAVIPTVFLIVSNINITLLVGCDFLKDTKAIIDFKQELLIINNEHIKFNVKPTIKHEGIFNIKLINNNEQNNTNDTWNKQINNVIETLKNEDPMLVKKYVDTFNNNRDIFSDTPGLANNYECKLKFKEDVKLFKKSYPIPFKQREAVRKEIEKMLKNDIIEYSESQFINPIVPVQKSSGEVRLCLDGRQINTYISRDYTEPENIDNILLRFHGCRYMTSFDLTSGFFQVSLEKESRKYVAFSVFGRMYQFKRVPFGLSVSSAEFIKCLYKVLGEEILEWIVIYVDDLAVCSKTLEEHIFRLNQLFQRLREGNLTLKLNKSKFITGELKYLGYIINQEGICADAEKTKAIQDFPEPRNIKQLQSFLGLCNYYRKFQKNYSYLTAKFKDILCKKKISLYGERNREKFLMK